MRFLRKSTPKRTGEAIRRGPRCTKSETRGVHRPRAERGHEAVIRLHREFPTKERRKKKNPPKKKKRGIPRKESPFALYTAER